MNNRAEQEEKQHKDIRKQWREESLANDAEALQCDHPGCVFTAVNLAGLVNHKRQRHIQPQLVYCQFRGQSFRKKGVYNHQRYCSDRPLQNWPLACIIPAMNMEWMQHMDGVCGCVLGAKRGFAQSMDCAVPSMDPCFARWSMDCAVRKVQSFDVHKTWISLTRVWLYV